MYNKLKNFRNLSPAVKASMALLFANLVLKGLSMISGPIFTRIMSTSEYGVVSTFMSWQSLLSTIITLNLGAGVFNNGMVEFREDRDRFQFSLIVISVTTAISFIIVYRLFSAFFNKLFALPANLIYLLGIYFVFVPIYGYWSGRQRYELKYKALTVITIGMGIVSLVVSVIAVIFIKSDSSAIVKIYASEIPYIILGCVFFFVIGMKAKFQAKKAYIVYSLKFNLPLLPHYLSMYVLSSSDRIMISRIISTSATAIYSVSYTVGMVINILWQSIEASLSPWIYEALNKNNKLGVKKRTFQILLIFFVACVLSCLFAPEIIAILAPKEYYEGIYVIPSIAASSFFIAAYSVYMRVELYHKQTIFAMVATTVAAGVNLLLNYIFIRTNGFIAAGYTTLASYAILTLMHYFNVRKCGYDDCLDNKRILVLSIIVIASSSAINIVYSYNFLRYILILIILIVCILKHSIIIDAIKK